MRTRGFTLLEAVIALVILSSFVVACLQLRLNGLRAGQEIASSQRLERAFDDIIELAGARLLPEPIVERDDDNDIARIVWRGEHAGFTYECVADQMIAPAPDWMDTPIAGAPVQRYTVTIDDRSIVAYRPLTPGRES